MTERLRLFLIIALGEVVLTTGSAIAEHPSRPRTLIAGSGAFAITASLWALYFGRTNQLVEDHMAHTTDPVRAARLGANGQYVVLAGLIAVAVGCEIVVAHPSGDSSTSLALLLFGGALLYVGAQTWYLASTTREPTAGRWVGCGLLAAGAAVSTVLPPIATLLLLAAILVTFAISIGGQAPARRDLAGDLPPAT